MIGQIEQKDAQIRVLRKKVQFLQAQLYTYFIEIDKANKGLRRLVKWKRNRLSNERKNATDKIENNDVNQD